MTGAASDRFVIVGGGAAGFAAAEMLRRRGFAGSITMLSNDDAAPVDRPNLSKDYLAGSAPEDWLPLRGDDWYAENNIDAQAEHRGDGARPARQADRRWATATRSASTSCCSRPAPSRCGSTCPARTQTHVHTLRSLSDSRAIIASAEQAKRAVVIGASFIGLETAASLRARGIEVHVVAPEKRPLERVFGPSSAISSAPCTRSMASTSIWRTA